MTTVGLISDTHGLLRPQALEALKGVDHIIHAGDVGEPLILEALQAIAPLTAVRGNIDLGEWANLLPLEATVTVGGRDLYVLHILKALAIDPQAAGIQAVISGHTHKPMIERRNGILYVNPGSAGPRRFTLPISLGFMRIAEGRSVEAWIQTLDI
jgi:putative phosphoesterase